MEYPKIALKSGGTFKGGKQVINYLESFGATNPDDYKGYGSGYYYIYGGEINTTGYFPEGYTLVTLEQKQKLFKLI